MHARTPQVAAVLRVDESVFTYRFKMQLGHMATSTNDEARYVFHDEDVALESPDPTLINQVGQLFDMFREGFDARDCAKSKGEKN